MGDMIVDVMDEDTQKGRYLIFSIDNDNYGIEIQFVVEIIGIQTITPISGLPEYVRGIINLRGKIIPVIDVRLRFKKAFKEYNERTCIIIVDINGINVGLIVDSVSEVVRINEEDISELPNINQKSQNIFVKNIGKIGNEVRLLLDCAKLLSEEYMESLNEIV